MEEGDSLCCFILHNWASPIWTKQRWKPIRKPAKDRPLRRGQKALYLNSFYIDRRYYLPYGSISRVFKRVAMSRGGFSGKGMFASMAYLVVEYDGGKQKQCNFKDERDVDALLEVLAKEQPNIPRPKRRRRGGNCPPEGRESRPEAAPALERGRAERGPAQARIGLPRQETGACQRAQRCRAPQARPAAEQAGV